MKLQWHSPWLYLLILINVIVYVVVGLIARRTVKVSPGLCEVHAAERNRRIWMFLGAGGAVLAAGVGLVMADESGAAVAFFVLGLLILIVAMLATRKVYAGKITKEYARLGGCKEPFLSSLES